MTTFHFKLVRRKTKENKVIVPKLATTTICVSVHLNLSTGKPFDEIIDNLRPFMMGPNAE